MNTKQKDSTAKYLYDVSKGLLLAAIVGVFTNKATVSGLVISVLLAGYAYWVAYVLEE